MIPDKSARILIIERTYGQHIETLVWGNDVAKLARKWGISRTAVYEWRVKFPRTADIQAQVRCECGSTEFEYDNLDVIQCLDCSKVTTWMLAHRRHNRAL